MQITVLTATYNRAHLLGDLYDSLCRQTSKNFIWIIIDDGSSDGTKQLCEKWLHGNNGFKIEYWYIENGGKNRAINLGVARVETPYTMIMDSDDYLVDDAIEKMNKAIAGVSGMKTIAGVSGMKAIAGVSGKSGEFDITSLNQLQKDYIDASNLERKELGINRDCCEVYKTEILRLHPFMPWKGEKFVPEEIVWNQIALEGYKLRWFNFTTCIVRYQEGGLTKGAWSLLKNNPMGYAMMFNHRLLYEKSFQNMCYNTIQLISCTILGHHLKYLLKSNNKFLTMLLFPIGWAVAIRRYMQLARK